MILEVLICQQSSKEYSGSFALLIKFSLSMIAVNQYTFGQNVEREHDALDHSVATIGWNEIPDV
jgi:hypothetical protein